MKGSAYLRVALTLGVVLVAYQNCSKVEFAQVSSEKSNGNPVLICDPLSGSQDCDGGVLGEIYYMTDAQRAAHGDDSVSKYFQYGTQLPAIIALNDIFVPTRKFEEGFPSSETGDYLMTSNNQRLVEWFALKLYSDLKLQASDAETNYQFAVLSDDGAILLNRDTRQVIVNNDGTHSTQLGCGTFAVSLSKAQALPIEVQYYQGPRTQIALTVLWRKVPASGDLSDPLCDASGNDHFFGPNYNDFSTAYGYGQLVSRGWSPVPAANLTRVTNY